MESLVNVSDNKRKSNGGRKWWIGGKNWPPVRHWMIGVIIRYNLYWKEERELLQMTQLKFLSTELSCQLSHRDRHCFAYRNFPCMSVLIHLALYDDIRRNAMVSKWIFPHLIILPSIDIFKKLFSSTMMAV